MRRSLFTVLFVGLLAVSPGAAWSTPLPTRDGRVTGVLTSTGAYSFTVQTQGRPVGVINALAAAADKLSAGDFPYVWGGGHAEAGVASVGSKGPGHNGRRRGFDCSGSVAAVLAGAGLWPAGSGVPNDAGVILYLRQHGEIATGAGVGPHEVTLYDQPGVHIFMNIDGRFFGTSDGAGGANRRGGPGWLDDGATDARSGRFRRYHLLPSVLRATTTAGYALSFQFGPGVAPLSTIPPGARVNVAYRTTNEGTMVAQQLTLAGLQRVRGTVRRIRTDATAFTVVTRAGHRFRFDVGDNPILVRELSGGQIAVGDRVLVSFITKPSLTVADVTVTAEPTPTTTTTTPTTTTTTTPTTTTPTTTTGTTTTGTTTTGTTTTTTTPVPAP